MVRRGGVALLVVLGLLLAGAVAVWAAPPPPPTPVTPGPGSVLPQNNLPTDCTVYGVSWDFDWEASPGAARYQVRIDYAGTPVPVYSRVFVSDTHATVGKCGCFDQSSLANWQWLVRAQSAAGQWGDWSEPVPFTVEPFYGCRSIQPEQ